MALIVFWGNKSYQGHINQTCYKSEIRLDPDGCVVRLHLEVVTDK